MEATLVETTLVETALVESAQLETTLVESALVGECYQNGDNSSRTPIFRVQFFVDNP